MPGSEEPRETSKRLRPCRYCKTPIPKGSKRCPACGILTPHSDAKSTMIWIAVILAVVYLYSLIRA